MQDVGWLKGVRGKSRVKKKLMLVELISIQIYFDLKELRNLKYNRIDISIVLNYNNFI